MGGEAVDRGRWNTEGRPLATGYRLPITDYRSPTTDYRSPMTDQPRSWACFLRGFGVGCCEKRPGAGEERRERRDRFVSVPKPGWTLSAGLRYVLGANRKGSACCTLRAQSPSLSPRGIPRRNPQQADPFVHPALTGATRPSYTRPMAARYGDWSPRLGSLAGRRPRRLWTP